MTIVSDVIIVQIEETSEDNEKQTEGITEETTASISLMKDIAENVEKSLNQIIEE